MLIQTQPTNLGYLAQGGGNSPLVEMATYTCTHCGTVVVMNPERKRERYHCKGCSHLICDPCAALRAAGEPCKTLRQKIAEEFEAVERAKQQRIEL